MALTCSTCKGKREVFAFINKGEDFRTHAQGMIRCVTCGGTGFVDDDQPKRAADGAAFRRARGEREESLFACAGRLGLTSAQLSAFENGRPVQDDVLVKIVGLN